MNEEQIKLIADYFKDLAAAWVVTGFITPVVEYGFDRSKGFDPVAGFRWLMVSLYYLGLGQILLLPIK